MQQSNDQPSEQPLSQSTVIPRQSTVRPRQPQEGAEESAGVTYHISPSDQTATASPINDQQLPSQPSSLRNESIDVRSRQHVREYPMKTENCGYCIIINNEKFNNIRLDSGMELKNRTGTACDERSLEREFKWLGFQVHAFNDQTADEMTSILKKFSNESHARSDAFVCVILSHGFQGGAYGVDGAPIMFKDIIMMYETCESLAGKPEKRTVSACQLAIRTFRTS